MKKIAWNGFLLIVAVGVGVAFSHKPWQIYRQQQRLSDRAKAEMRQAEKDKAELMALEAKYESPAGREELARSRGYLKPNERPIEVRR